MRLLREGDIIRAHKSHKQMRVKAGQLGVVIRPNTLDCDDVVVSFRNQDPDKTFQRYELRLIAWTR